MPDLEYKRWAYSLPDVLKCPSGRQFLLGEQLGAGGNGVVMLCEEATTGEQFAAKVQLNMHGVRPRRFEREVAVMRALRHEHIVPFIDFGDLDTTVTPHRGRRRTETFPVVIMRRADRSLADLLAERQTGVPFPEYFGQFMGLAGALVELHKHAIHRDIKPGNILVSGEIWQLSDFGLCGLMEAREDDLTRADEAVGPRYWMSPAAIAKAMGLGDGIEPRSDVFQLAAVFWFVATRRPPVGILTEEDWTDGPSDLCSLLLRALQHAPDRRPNSAEELLAGLESLRS